MSAPAKTATRHRCPAEASVHCQRGSGRPRGPKCATCGTRLVVEAGVYGIFAWTGTGRYPLAEAVATRLQEAAAERYVDTNAGHGYVVRWVVTSSD